MDKTLFILRCYSGFENSIIKRKWSPHGATTIAKLLTYIQKSKSNNILLISKSNNYELNKINNKKLFLKNLNIPIFLIKANLIYLNNTKIGKLYREIYNNIFIIYYLYKLKPKIIYIDHANIYIGAFICRFFKVKTVVRLMGIKDDMRNCLKGSSLFNKLLRWSYNSPFSMVIATQDGAGAEIWMGKALRKSVPRKTILNGVDKISHSLDFNLEHNLPKNKNIITFIGRLENDKAPDKFIESFIKIEKYYPNKCHGLIIGSGSMKEQLLKRIHEARIGKCITFFADLNNIEIFELLRISKIYVSLNRNGNLSNSNIEVMAAGKAMIMPSSQKHLGIDLYTDLIIHESAVLRINNSDSVDELSNAVIYLAKNPQVRKKLEKNILIEARKFIKTWDARMMWEYELLSIINNNQSELINYIKKD